MISRLSTLVSSLGFFGESKYMDPCFEVNLTKCKYINIKYSNNKFNVSALISITDRYSRFPRNGEYLQWLEISGSRKLYKFANSVT
jgi:hypothetical protein